jgi:hypothetical protein
MIERSAATRSSEVVNPPAAMACAHGAPGELRVLAGTPLASWFRNAAALGSFRRGAFGQHPAVLPPRNRAWRSLAPSFEESLAMIARGGLAFQIAADRRHDRSGDPRRLARAVRSGATIFLPQIHQVLPRVMRLMVALRAALLGPFREECSFLFLVEGRGRTGMGLHHDGGVDALWIQIEGRRTVTVGPPVARRTPQEIRASPPAGDRRWATFDLEPGSLFSLPPWTPHEVVCHGRSLALSLTWAAPRHRRQRGAARSLTRWDVVSGRVSPMPSRRPDRLWTQVPVLTGPIGPDRRTFTLWTPDGSLDLPATARPLARRLVLMPSLRRPDARPPAALRLLTDLGILAPHDLPLRILPEDPETLDGWRFA